MTTITTEQLETFRDADVAIPVVNVLDKESFRQGHIPDSINIPAGSANFVMDVAKVTENERSPIVVYCASASCDASERAAAQLERAGFSKVYDYEGGTQAWEDAGLPVV